MSIRPPFEASADPSNERSATVSKFRRSWIFAVSLDKSICTSFFHGLNAFVLISYREYDDPLFADFDFRRIFIYRFMTRRTMESKGWKLARVDCIDYNFGRIVLRETDKGKQNLHDTMRYKCITRKMEYHIYTHWYDSRMDLATLFYKSDTRGGGMFVVWICLFYLYIT